MPDKSKPYTVTFPLTEEQAENLDRMLADLYERVAQLENPEARSDRAQQASRVIHGR